jgi:D-beta-D-heptose 7-phosphate kinase/D-beta-D-heptose 1-phosphate adenosyltransferase
MTPIISLKDLISKIPSLRSNQTLVLATGVFDILHSEHKKFLLQAKKQGDILLVGLESDTRVKQLKGKTRPLHPLKTRLQNLAKLNLAHYIFPLPEKFSSSQDHQNLIKKLRPHLLAVSSHTPNQPQKQKLIEKYDGKLKVVHQHNPQISTSQLLHKS